MVAFQNDAFGLNVWRLISGIGLGLEMVTIGAYISEMAPKGMRGKAFACSQAIGFCCVPIISFLAYVLVPIAPFGVEGWRWVVLIGALAAALIGFLRFSLPESPRWLARQGRLEEADRVLGGIEAKVAAEYGGPLPDAGAGRADFTRRRLRRSLGPAGARTRDPDERLQYFPDGRILRLQQLGALAARQTGHHDLDQPGLHHAHRARRAHRAADRVLRRGSNRAQIRHRRRGGRHPRLRPDFRLRRASPR